MTIINELCPWIFTVDTTTVMSYPHPISSDLQTLITSPCWNVALLPLDQMLLSLTQALMQWKCKQQWLVGFLFSGFAWVSSGPAFSLQNSEQSAKFHRLPDRKGAHCCPWVPVDHSTCDLGFCGSLLFYQHYVGLGIIKKSLISLVLASGRGGEETSSVGFL